MRHYRYDDLGFDYPTLTLRVFNCVRETPCGYWIEETGLGASSKRRWVSKTSNKRYAYPSLTDAWHSYRIRKYGQQHHLIQHLRYVTRIVDYLEEQGHTPPIPLPPANDPGCAPGILMIAESNSTSTIRLDI